jgi:hypothetical protein
VGPLLGFRFYAGLLSVSKAADWEKGQIGLADLQKEYWKQYARAQSTYWKDTVKLSYPMISCALGKNETF